jgi:hypothetical protein
MPCRNESRISSYILTSPETFINPKTLSRRLTSNSVSPPQPPIYLLSTSELATLREFIDKHLNMGYIRPTRSSHGAPILFVKKKDGSLQLCVNLQVLNKVMKKDRYPLPLISDLLDAPQKAWLYTKIDLQHAYHLV